MTFSILVSSRKTLWVIQAVNNSFARCVRISEEWIIHSNDSSHLGYPAPPTASLYNRSFVVTNVNGPSIGNFLVDGRLLFSGNGSLENWTNFASSKKRTISIEILFLY